MAWNLWAKSLGQKEGKSNKEADAIAAIRTLILLTYLVTNCFITAGVIRHWNDQSCLENSGSICGDSL